MDELSHTSYRRQGDTEHHRRRNTAGKKVVMTTRRSSGCSEFQTWSSVYEFEQGSHASHSTNLFFCLFTGRIEHLGTSFILGKWTPFVSNLKTRARRFVNVIKSCFIKMELRTLWREEATHPRKVARGATEGWKTWGATNSWRNGYISTGSRSVLEAESFRSNNWDGEKCKTSGWISE